MARAVFGSGLPKALAGSAVCFGVLAMAGPLIMPMVLDVKTQEIVNSLISGSDPLERTEDGSARWPHMFRDWLRRNETLLKGLGDEHPEWPDIVKSDDVEKFQDMMRNAKQETEQRRQAVESAKMEKDEKINKKLESCLRKGKKSPQQCEQAADQARMKNNPNIRRMKMMGPTPTEDDAYNQQAPEVPAHMRCDACQAVVWQGAVAVAAALAARKRDDKVSILTIEALETTCHNTSLWMYEYGYAPGKAGVNLFVGPGVAGREKNDPLHWEENNGDTVVPQTQHSDGIGRRLSSACLAVLLGESPDEEEIAGAVLEAGVEPEATAQAARALRKMACEKPGQPCANAHS